MVILVELTLYLLVGLLLPVHAQQPAQIGDILGIIKNIISILTPAAAIAFFVMMILAAFRFIKAKGDPKLLNTARDTVKYALFGVVLVAGSWVILKALELALGVPITSVSFNP